MKNGFTLLEIVIVIIIISILASVGFVSYGDVAERSRASEAKEICSKIKDAEELYILYNDEATSNISNLSIGDIPQGTNPAACSSGEHYFTYAISLYAPDGLSGYDVNAYRCTGAGKYPNTTTTYGVNLEVDRTTGGAIWTGRFAD